MNYSTAVFSDNLVKFCRLNGCTTYDQMASYIGVPLGTLKCWLSKNRNPGMLELNKLADRLGCKVYNLIKPGGDLTNRGVPNRDIHQVFAERLQTIFLQKQRTTYDQKVIILNDCITKHSLVSYFRQRNYRMPTLERLDQIADALKIKSYELLEDESND